MIFIQTAGDHFLRFLDAVAPPFFFVGLIAAVLSYWTEYIGGMASRGKTRPHISATTTSCSSSSSFSAIQWFLYGDQWSVPKKYFLHYYVSGFVVISIIILLWGGSWLSSQSIDNDDTVAFTSTPHPMTPATAAILVTSTTQCLRRIYECCYVHTFATTSRMHLLFYILAIFYYVFIPANLVDLPFDHGASNKDVRLAAADSRQRLQQHQLMILVVVGATLFGFWAQYQQYRHHVILADLRKCADGPIIVKPSDNSPYKIPRGGWFEYVTCPHYTAEVLLYMSYGVLIWADDRLPLLLPNLTDSIMVLCREYRYYVTFAFVVANLLFAALNSHYWYSVNFDKYEDLNRKLMIPFIL